MRPILALVLLTAVPAAADARSTLTAERGFTVGDARRLQVDFPAGALAIRHADSDRIEVVMKAHCREAGSGCEERAQRIRLVADRSGDRRVLRLEGLSKTLPRGPAVELSLRVPSRLGIDVHMGAGDLEIRDLRSDVDVEMGAGSVEVRGADGTVGSVVVHVGVGDARLRRAGGDVEGRGFIAKNLRWSSGGSGSQVSVDLGVGDVEVTLD